GGDDVVEVGGAGTVEKSCRAVRTAGHVALIGVLSGSGSVNPVHILMRAVNVRGILVGSRALFEEMNRAFDLHKIRPVVDYVFPFEEFPRALEYLESAAHFGKVVVRVGVACQAMGRPSLGFSPARLPVRCPARSGKHPPACSSG